MARSLSLALFILFLLAGILPLVLWPEHARLVGSVILSASLALGATLAARKHIRLHRQGFSTRKGMALGITLDILGLLLVMAAAMLAGGYAGQLAASWGGEIPGLLAGFATGLSAAWLARRLWEKFTTAIRPLSPSSTRRDNNPPAGSELARG
ncbi:MAG: hypothetical protein FJZ96_01370 [Chloroflexi bacterium]|nr:hypothetical protein [Chloroflexota bacterium]